VQEFELIEQVRSIIATTFGVDDTEIPDDISQDTCGLWTSLQHMLLMVAIEDRFELQLTMDEMLGMRTLADIVGLLRGRKQSIAA
jgi:acyl carrier protein